MIAHKNYIGIDLGTSAVKLLLLNETGKILHSVTKEYPCFFPYPGWSEQQPEDWWNAVAAGIPELLAGIDPCSVAGIGVGGHLGESVHDLRRRRQKSAVA